MATHSSILAWEISWTEKPGGLQSKGSQKESDTTQWWNKESSNPPHLGSLSIGRYWLSNLSHLNIFLQQSGLAVNLWTPSFSDWRPQSGQRLWTCVDSGGFCFVLSHLSFFISLIFPTSGWLACFFLWGSSNKVLLKDQTLVFVSHREGRREVDRILTNEQWLSSSGQLWRQMVQHTFFLWKHLFRGKEKKKG